VIFKSLLTAQKIINVTAHEAGHWLDLSPQYHSLLASSAPLSSDGTFFTTELNRDWDNLNDPKRLPCTATTKALLGPVFKGDQSETGIWICAGVNGQGPVPNNPPFSGTNEQVLKQAWPDWFDFYVESIQIGGKASINDVLTIAIKGLSPNPQNATSAVPSNSTTTTQMAAGLAASINSNPQLNYHIAADHYGSTVFLYWVSLGLTYSASVSGKKTETLTAAPMPVPSSREIFPQEFEVVSGNRLGGPASPDNFFQNMQFSCTGTLVTSLMAYGQVPGRQGSVMPWPTGQGCLDI
jgi:hypothetical protein